METSLLKKLRKKTAPEEASEEPSIQEGLAGPMTPLPAKSVDMSSKLFRRLKQDGATSKRNGGRRLMEAVPTPPSLDDDAPPKGPAKFHAGKRVTGEVQESRVRRVGASNLAPYLRMFEDIGWDLVLDRVRDFVKHLSLTEVAQKFQAPQESLIEEVLQSWRDAGLHKEELISSRLQSVPETAAALIVYVNEFQQED